MDLDLMARWRERRAPACRRADALEIVCGGGPVLEDAIVPLLAVNRVRRHAALAMHDQVVAELRTEQQVWSPAQGGNDDSASQ